MDRVFGVFAIVLVAAVIVYLIYAWATGRFRRGVPGPFTSQVILHDMLDLSKQKAMEYHMDEQEKKDEKDARSGEDDEPGDGEEDQKNES
jgi:thiosulfate reductase cytochrome b subunit